MNLKLTNIMIVLHFISGTTEMMCPGQCVCFENHNYHKTICNKGNMNFIPTEEIDPNVDVIEIVGPNNDLIIGPIFTKFKKLEVLRIIESNVPAIGTHSLWGLKSLRILDLQRNNITQLSDDNFRGQDNLIELDLSGNVLERFPSAVFQYLTSLKILNLADNNIQELVQRLFYKLSKLTYLDLSGNPLDLLPPDVFRDIQDLLVLKCRRCKLNKINPQLYNLVKNLVELDLGENQFQYFETTEFSDLTHLKKLYLDRNELPVIVNKFFTFQKSLEVLDISHNRLARIPNLAFQNLYNLSFIDISYNKLKVIEEQCLSSLISLETFNISGNIHIEFDVLLKELEVLENLKSLSIADLNLRGTIDLFHIQHLTFLNLSGNSLTSNDLRFLDSLLDSKDLKLDLSRNGFSDFDIMNVEHLSSIKDVNLDYNPIVCDQCHMGPLINRSKELTWKSIPICFLPENLRGNSINSLDVQLLEECIDFQNYENNNAASISMNFIEQVLIGNMNWFAITVAIIIGCVAILFLLCSVFYKYQHRSYYTNESKDFPDKRRESHQSGSQDEVKFPFKDNINTIQKTSDDFNILNAGPNYNQKYY